MSIKHVIKEYDRICNDFKEMVSNLQDMNDLATQNIVSQEQVEAIKSIVEPMKVNKARWDYMMFLLNMPNKKEKRDYYIRQNGKIIDNIRKIAEEEQEENQECLNDLKKAVKELE